MHIGQRNMKQETCLAIYKILCGWNCFCPLKPGVVDMLGTFRYLWWVFMRCQRGHQQPARCRCRLSSGCPISIRPSKHVSVVSNRMTRMPSSTHRCVRHTVLSQKMSFLITPLQGHWRNSRDQSKYHMHGRFICQRNPIAGRRRSWKILTVYAGKDFAEFRWRTFAVRPKMFDVEVCFPPKTWTRGEFHKMSEANLESFWYLEVASECHRCREFNLRFDSRHHFPWSHRVCCNH